MAAHCSRAGSSLTARARAFQTATSIARRPLVHSLKTLAMDRHVIATDQAPGAVGPYSQAIRTGNTIYVSGQVGLVPGTKSFASEEVEGQCEQVMKNIGAILEAAGAGYSNIVKTTILLEDMADFQKVNGVYGKYFPENPPARATFAVKGLPLGAKVEIEAIAVL